MKLKWKEKREEKDAGRDACAPAAPAGWHDRGYLPHFDGGEITQFITVHLGDALPKAVIDRWKLELEKETDEEKKMQLYWRAEKYVDQGFGECYLRIEPVANIVRDAFKYYDGVKYTLIAWVIMPNHFHILLRPFEGVLLEKIIHSIKSFSAQKANKLLGRTGKFWQEEYFDRYIRDAKHFAATVKYIEMNPVKANLCAAPEDWPFGSASERGHQPEPGHPCPPVE